MLEKYLVTVLHFLFLLLCVRKTLSYGTDKLIGSCSNPWTEL